MTDPDKPIREQLEEMLLQQRGKPPTSAFRRLGRTAVSLLKTGRLLRRHKRSREEASPLDPKRLAAIVSAIGSLKGVSMKIGQIMSYIDVVTMPEEMLQALSVLQTHAQPMEFGRVKEIVTADLPYAAGDLLACMDPVPVAAASIGQVHRAKLPDGTAVAVKVRYPEVEDAIRSDFRPAAIGTKIASLFYPGARIDDFVEEARARFLEECDYQHEAEAQARFVRLFANHPVITVPAIHPVYCARRVLTSTWVEGARFDAYLGGNPAQADRDRLGEALFGFYVGTLFRHGLYNCDPHPGNYLFLPDGKLAILDYGCTRDFAPDFVASLAALTRAVHLDEREALHRAFVDLGLVRPDRPYDFATARDLVRSFYGPMLHDTTQPIDLGGARSLHAVYQSKRKLLKLTLPGEFLFLFRIRFGLLSVLARLGSRANWYRLERGYLGLESGSARGG